MGLEIYLNPLLVEESEGQPIVDGMKSLAAGSDILSIRTLKKSREVIAPIFVSLINKCLKEGVFPSYLNQQNLFSKVSI